MKILMFVLLSCFQILSAQAQSGTWTWMKGDPLNMVSANYGIQGVPSPGNIPAADYQTSYWTDNQGNLWMYTGVYPATNDMWKFDVLTNNWTWMSGTQNSLLNYGVQGIPSPNNFPGSRLYGTNCWTDKNNDLWLYSGYLSSPDLWKYSISTNEWTWMKGDPLVGGFYNFQPVFGIQGISNAANSPGDLQETKSGWVTNDNKIWLFGGGSYGRPPNNNMWRFDISTNQWAWMKGDTSIFGIGSYGIKGVESPSNLPQGRLNYTRWISKSDDLFVFGGDITDTSSIISGFRKNDVWRYRPSTNNWTWVSGSDTALPIGINNGYCKQDKNIEPQDRFENLTVTASDCNRTSWLFGGYSQLYALNDLWSFNTENYEWTLVKGNPDSTDYNQNFGIQGIESISNEISARGGSAIWSDKEHNIWIFGGVVYLKDSLQNILPQERNDLWRYKPDYACFNAVLSSGDPFQPPLDSVICQGEITKSRLNGNYITSILPSTGFNINEDSSEISFFPSTTTTYTVVSSNPCSNQNVLVFTIIVLPSPVANFSFGKPSYEMEDGIITFNNQSQNAASYEWYYNNQLISVLPNPTFPIDSNKEYCFTLIVKNTEGCSDTSINCVTVNYFPPDDIFVPNAFSPNEDGINDAFGVTSNDIPNFNLYIFNRYGEQVAHLTSPKEKWNGYYKNRLCDLGSYYYYLNYSNHRGISKIIKGDILLLK